MIKTFLASLALIASLLITSAPARAADVDDLNRMIDQTNFIVGGGCSGTLISIERRLILTNHHCIAGSVRTTKKKVTDSDGKITEVEFERLDPVTVGQRYYKNYDEVGTVTYKTKIVEQAKARDLALLYILSDDLRATQFAPLLPKSTKVKRGEPVFAVGNPRGLDATVTAGIISNINRSFPVSWAGGEQVSFIQIDAPINPGNSGGSLYSSDLFLIGVPAATFPGADGLALAIPVDTIREFLDDACYSDIYDGEAVEHDACIAFKEAEEKDEE